MYYPWQVICTQYVLLRAAESFLMPKEGATKGRKSSPLDLGEEGTA